MRVKRASAAARRWHASGFRRRSESQCEGCRAYLERWRDVCRYCGCLRPESRIHLADPDGLLSRLV